MELGATKFLLSAEGRKALDELTQTKITSSDELKVISKLRKTYDMGSASALIDCAMARQKAITQEKFSRAERMFFTRTALEQASGERIARYRAKRFLNLCNTKQQIADLCCGIGGDTIALSQDFKVSGFDRDEARLLMAQANAAEYDNGERFRAEFMDVKDFAPAGFTAAFFDPARRDADGKRIFHPERYGPPLSTIYPFLGDLKGIAVKVSPSIDYDALRESAPKFEVELISENGEVKEAVLWFGELRSLATRRATMLLRDKVLNFDDSDGVPQLKLSPLKAFIHEPDGAIIRAGLVELLGEQLCAEKVDEQIAYLTGDEPSKTEAARSFEIIDHMPFSMKRLKKRLGELNCSRVTVKKRGSPLTPEEVQNALALRGDGIELTVILTRVAEEHTAIICRPRVLSGPVAWNIPEVSSGLNDQYNHPSGIDRDEA